MNIKLQERNISKLILLACPGLALIARPASFWTDLRTAEIVEDVGEMRGEVGDVGCLSLIMLTGVSL